MSYELRFPPDTRTEIGQYIRERFEGRRAQDAAAAVILTELEKLTANPALGSSRAIGPFESRLIYRFAIYVDGIARYVQVAYKVHKKDRVVVVSGFRPVML